METSRLKAFIKAVDLGTFRAAADSLGYTTSAISQLISSLENELGLKLLTRSQKGVRPTSEGEALIPLVRSYLAREDEIYQFAAELKGVTSGRISIAAYPSVATNWLPAIVRKFKNDFPGIHIDIMECIRPDLYRHLDQKEADLGILAFAEPMPFEWIPLVEEPVIAAIPDDHPMADAESFPIRQFAKEDFILSSWGQELEILNILHKNGVYPEIKYTTYDTPATLAMVSMGLGVSLTNGLCSGMWSDHLVKMPIDPPSTISFGVAVPSVSNMTNSAKKFLEYTVNYITGIKK